MKFPVPTEGTAWASGGISGKVKVFNRSRRRKSSRFRKKPWESTNWVPYFNLFNNGWGQERIGTVNSALVLDTVGEAKRPVLFGPRYMDESTAAAITTGDFQGTVATEQSWKVKRVQGHVHVDGIAYANTASDAPGTFLWDAVRLQAGVTQRIFWSWQKEQVTAGGYVQNVDDLGVGYSVLSEQHALQNKHILNWGVMDWVRPKSTTNGNFVGDDKGDRTFLIPGPKLPPGGLKLGQNDALTLIVRGFYGLMYGRDNLSDTAQQTPLPIAMELQPMMRFLIAA